MLFPCWTSLVRGASARAWGEAKEVLTRWPCLARHFGAHFICGGSAPAPLGIVALSCHIRFVVPTKEKKIFITIDDAPSESTREILRVLKKHNVPATFFVIADCVKSPSQLDEIVAAKHSLGNHLRTFKACSKLSLPEFRADLEACSVLLERFEKPRYFRPPCGLGTKEQIAYARSRGYRAVAGTVFPLDHCISDSRWLVRLARWLSVKGGILILHDGQTHGRTTAAVLEVLLPQLKAAGYEFGRLEEAP